MSEQVAPDDIYMYIGGVKVKVSDFGGRDFTLTYGSDGALLPSESRFPAVEVPYYREMVSGIPISKMTPAELLVAQALEVPVSDVTGLYKVADRFGAIGSLIINIGLTGGLGAQAQAGNLAVRAAQASVASSRAVTAMMAARATVIGKGVLEKLIAHGLAKGRHADLGLPAKDAALRVIDLVSKNLSRLKTGDNTLYVVINGVQKTIKAFVEKGVVISINIYPGVSNRVTQGVIIELGKLIWKI